MSSSWRRDVLSNSYLHSCGLCIPVNDDDSFPTLKDPQLHVISIDIHSWSMLPPCTVLSSIVHTVITLSVTVHCGGPTSLVTSFMTCPTHFTDLPSVFAPFAGTQAIPVRTHLDRLWCPVPSLLNCNLSTSSFSDIPTIVPTKNV
jgi:hypothetical protein